MQNAVLSNSIVMTPSRKALAEIELLLEHGIRMPNGALDYTRFLTGPRQAVDYERLKSVKSSYASEFLTKCGEICMTVNAHKTAVRQQVKKMWEDQKAKLGALGYDKKASESYGHQPPQPINQFTLVRLLHDYKHALVHVACRQLSRNVQEDAWKVELMHTTHRDLKHRTNLFGGLPPEHHIFSFEASHLHDTEPPFLQAKKLLLDSKSGLFDGIVKNGESASLPKHLISTIPSPSSIFKLKNFSEERQEALSKSESLFQRFQSHFDYSSPHLELLVYRNLTSQFNHENRYPTLMRALFEDEVVDNQKVSYLDILRSYSLPCKLAKLYRNVVLVLEFILTDIRHNIKPMDQIDMQNAADQNRKYWRIDEANTPEQARLNKVSEDPEDVIENKTMLIEDEILSQKIIDQVSQSRRQQQQVFEEFLRATGDFNQVVERASKRSKGNGLKLDDLLQHL